MNKRDDKHSLLRDLVSQKRYVFDIFFITALTNLLIVIPAIFSLEVYDKVLTSRNNVTLAVLTVILLMVLIAVGILEYIRKCIALMLANQIESSYIKNVINGALALANSNPGNSSSQVFSDLTSIKSFISGGGLFKFLDAPWAPIYMILIFAFNFWLGIFSVVVLAIIILIAMHYEKVIASKTITANRKTNLFLQETMTDMRSASAIISMGISERLNRKWVLGHVNNQLHHNEATIGASKVQVLAKFVRGSSQSLILALAALLVIKGDLSSGAIIASTILITRILSPIEGLINNWKEFNSAVESYKRLKALNELGSVKKYETVPNEPLGRVVTSAVFASYPGLGKPVLKNINIKIEPGTIVLLHGQNGSGKSTLLKVVSGINKPISGLVKIDDMDIYKWDMTDLGRHIGYLDQEPNLLSGTIAQNIARFDTQDSSNIIALAAKVGVHEAIMGLDLGYETRVGIGGASLSCGVAQKICIARALYGEPKLIILDEPTNFLDEESTKKLRVAISDYASKGSTIIISSHDKSILEIAMQIYTIRDGMIHPQMDGVTDAKSSRNGSGNITYSKV